MTNEKSLQVAQGLSILSLLIASGRIDGTAVSDAFANDSRGTCLRRSLFRIADNMSDETRARLLDAIEMVSP